MCGMAAPLFADARAEPRVRVPTACCCELCRRGRRYGLELGSSVGDLPTADVLISWSEAIIRQWDVLTGDKMIRRDILEELPAALL